MTEVLVLGSGGREHALADSIGRSPHVRAVYTAPGNAGTPNNVPIDPNREENFPALAAFVRERGIGLVVVGPELPLCLGLADRLEAEGVPVFGPVRRGALLEGDKAFARRFMERRGIPQPRFAVFTRWEAARDHLLSLPDARVVVKAAGLAGGKGAMVCGGREQALEAARRSMCDRTFGSAGETLVVEEFMDGEEASIFAVCDGREAVYLPAAQDHKRAFDGDLGPNTGGMGAYAPAPVVTPEVLEKVHRRIVRPTLDGMAGEGAPYRGCLYVGLMIAGGEPRVVEYNCRFGDPETQAVLPLLSVDLYELLRAAATGDLGGLAASWPASAATPRLVPCRDGAAACVVLASGGYPDRWAKGLPVGGLEEAAGEAGLQVFHAGTGRDASGRVVTAGGRVFGVTGVGPDIRAAVDCAYRGAELIRFDGIQFRRDIAYRVLDRGQTRCDMPEPVTGDGRKGDPS
jgi:phosphoribosylamine---glycine ligase